MFSKKKQDMSLAEQKEAKLKEILGDVDPSTLVCAFDHDIDDSAVPEGTIFIGDGDDILDPSIDLTARFKSK